MRELLTLDQAAARLRIHVQTLRAWVREGRVPSFRMGRRFARVDWDTLLRTLSRERHGQPAEAPR